MDDVEQPAHLDSLLLVRQAENLVAIGRITQRALSVRSVSDQIEESRGLPAPNSR